MMEMIPWQTSDTIRRSGRRLTAPFQIRCADGETISISRLLRVLPGKRLSGEGYWRNRRVLAKLFVSRSSNRHWKREQHGLSLLHDAGLPTPEIVGAGHLDKGGHYLLTVFFDNAKTLFAYPSAPETTMPGNTQVTDVLRRVFALFGRLHGAELIHADPHPNNFLDHGDALLLIDGDGVKRMQGAAREQDRQTVNNMAQLISRLPLSCESYLDEMLAAYGTQQIDRKDLLQATEKERARYLRQLLGKTMRDCTQFTVQHTFYRFSSVVRREEELLTPLLVAPDAAIAAGVILKDNNSITVARSNINNREVVIKRYNLKNLPHVLSRCYRPSRAWQAAHRLCFYGIPTPAPLAMIEERLGPLRRRAFLITEFCPGNNLLHELPPEGEPDTTMAAAIISLFNLLFRLRITHGNLEATNFLWHNERLILIDLDAMIQHKGDAAFARFWRRDRARFLRNWPAGSTLHRWLDAHLPEAR